MHSLERMNEPLPLPTAISGVTELPVPVPEADSAGQSGYGG